MVHIPFIHIYTDLCRRRLQSYTHYDTKCIASYDKFVTKATNESPEGERKEGSGLHFPLVEGLRTPLLNMVHFTQYFAFFVAPNIHKRNLAGIVGNKPWAAFKYDSDF